MLFIFFYRTSARMNFRVNWTFFNIFLYISAHSFFCISILIESDVGIYSRSCISSGTQQWQLKTRLTARCVCGCGCGWILEKFSRNFAHIDECDSNIVGALRLSRLKETFKLPLRDSIEFKNRVVRDARMQPRGLKSPGARYRGRCSAAVVFAISDIGYVIRHVRSAERMRCTGWPCALCSVVDAPGVSPNFQRAPTLSTLSLPPHLRFSRPVDPRTLYISTLRANARYQTIYIGVLQNLWSRGLQLARRVLAPAPGMH